MRSGRVVRIRNQWEQRGPRTPEGRPQLDAAGGGSPRRAGRSLTPRPSIQRTLPQSRSAVHAQGRLTSDS